MIFILLARFLLFRNHFTIKFRSKFSFLIVFFFVYLPRYLFFCNNQQFMLDIQESQELIFFLQFFLYIHFQFILFSGASRHLGSLSKWYCVILSQTSFWVNTAFTFHQRRINSSLFFLIFLLFLFIELPTDEK